MLLSRQGHLLWKLVTQKQEEEEDEEAGSLLVSKQRKLQWSVEAGGSEEPGDDRYHIANSSDTEALVYTVHFEKRRFIFNSSVSAVWNRAHPDQNVQVVKKLKKNTSGCVEKASPI